MRDLQRWRFCPQIGVDFRFVARLERSGNPDLSEQFITVTPRKTAMNRLTTNQIMEAAMTQDLVTFANCLSGAISSGRVGPLNNLPLRTYLPLLKLERLIKLYDSIQGASEPQRRRLEEQKIPAQVADEIVFRTLVKIPRDFALLKEFLAAYFPQDRLNDAIPRILPFEIPPLYPRVKDLLDFDLAYLDALKSTLEFPTQFSSAIQRAVSRFANESYFVNVLFAVIKKDKEFSEETQQILAEHFLDGFVKQVVTDGQPAWAARVFDESSQVGELFLTTARRAQEAMGDCLGKIDFIRYQFVEAEETPIASYEGSSGGLALAELYYLAHTSLRSPLAPYTVFLGVLNEKREVGPVANLDAKIEAAKEYGIRILILPESNREQVPPYEAADGNLQFLPYNERAFSEVFPQLQSLRKAHGFLPSNNLPERRNRFIGREREIADIRAHLKKERLVTLTGTGGVGKTRLAETVAFDLLPSYPDGVWFIDLSALRDADLMLPTIASALSIQPQPRIPLKQQMIDSLKTRRTLLVLDNFEQLPHRAGELIEELIQNTSHLRCLVTSRDASTCPQGRVFLVSPLETPPPEAGLLIDSVDSVKLFLCRAEELGQPLSEDDFPTIAELCRTLDGIPLAIELAAARTVDLSPKELLSRIQAHLPLEVDESMDTVDPRHQKLQSVLSWSYDLLTESEQSLFAQLAVFSGGFFTEAVEQICTGKRVIGNQFSLRAKSLAQTEIAQGKKRYFLLEPVRGYAAEKLGDGEQVKKAHADYFCDWAKAQDEKLKGPEQSRALDEMATELNNCRAAMDFGQGQGGGKLLGELGVALSRFFEIRGLWSEGIHRLRPAAEALRRLRDNELLSKVLQGLGGFYQSQGDYETARNLYTESLQIARELGDKQYIAGSLNNLGIIAWYQGDYKEAGQFHTESLQIRQKLGDKHGIAASLNNLGIIALDQGAYDEARQLFTQSLQIKKELEDQRGIANSLNNLGETARRRGTYDEARQFFTQNLQIRQELEDKWGIADALINLGIIAGIQGAYDEAIRLFTQSLQIKKELEDQRGIADALINLGETARRQGAYNESRQFVAESLKIRRELTDKRGIANSLHQFGTLAEAEGDSAQAVLFLLAATRLHEEMQSADSTEAKEIGETLAGVQKEIGAEQFERLKGQADAMSDDEVVERALAWGAGAAVLESKQ
ncbi:tetratricopeptide repeat protein [Candidatus Poribacteria bacterium]|nr:tetratricopeptide repeat protein [Candidatus Poribacteria bacterium]